ncbi:MAG: hypothetical protein MPJ50_06005 [Pirellulales bacterium]|nr:hypothetical protein [Pirellulales bacterium]
MRKDKIEELLRDDPQDEFLRYSLAMELLKEESQLARSLDLFTELQQGEPPYVPAFFMAGQKLAELNRKDEARQTLTKGIAVAESQQNDHAAREMREFLASLD